MIDGKHDLALMLVSKLSNRQKLLSHTLVHSMRRLWLPPKHPLLNQEIITLADVALRRILERGLIGRTELALFDPARTPPTLLQPGDRVRFTIAGVKR